jgi:hypothetical protein
MPMQEEVEVGMARVVRDDPFGDTPHRQLQSCVVVIDGPDDEGDIMILAGAETYLPAETAIRLAQQILRRLGRAEEAKG